jgi:hypothetical protein
MPKSYILAWPVPYQVQFCAAARHAAQLYLPIFMYVCVGLGLLVELPRRRTELSVYRPRVFMSLLRL